MTTKDIAERLVALCREGKNEEAKATLYSPDIVSVEPHAPPGMSAEARGLEAVGKKGKWWTENHEVHSSSVRGPYVAGDRFAAMFNFDITPRSGPHGGQRMQMEEVALYTVRDGKIVCEEFMY